VDIRLVLVNEKGKLLGFGKYPVAMWVTHMGSQSVLKEKMSRAVEGIADDGVTSISSTFAVTEAGVETSSEEGGSPGRDRDFRKVLPEVIPCTVSDNEDGTYAMTFRSLLPGQYSVKVKVFGVMLSCCPFYAEIRPGSPQVLWGVDRGEVLSCSSVFEGNSLGYGPANLRVMDTSSSWMAASSGVEYLEMGLCAPNCVIARVDLMTFYAKSFKLSYRVSPSYAAESDPNTWHLFPSTPDWVPLPIGLGKFHSISISYQERLDIGMVSAVRLDIVNEGKKLTSFCGLNVFGWYE